MAEYRLSKRADADLFAIYQFTEQTFGAYHAHAYHAGFERTFGLLADFPRIGRPADELVPGYRRYRFQSHYVFYIEAADHILIVAILHTAMDLRPDLFD